MNLPSHGLIFLRPLKFIIQFLKTIYGDVFVCCKNYSYAPGNLALNEHMLELVLELGYNLEYFVHGMIPITAHNKIIITLVDVIWGSRGRHAKHFSKSLKLTN